MPSGGARGRSGPAPDPTALRRDRKDDQKTWITLPGPYEGPVPDWPLSVPASAQEQAHWDKLWRSPQAHQWAALGVEVEVALYVRSLAEAEIPGAAANLRTLVKQLQEGLGISVVGLNTRRWRIADAPETPTAATASGPAARPARTRPSARDRFKVVPAPPED